VRIAHADLVHVIERVADVVHAGPALPDPLGDQPRAAMQVELAHIRRVSGIGHKGERSQTAAVAQPDRHEARLVDLARHLATPEAYEAAAHVTVSDAKRHAPARAAGAEAHDQSWLAVRAAIARRQDAERPVVAVGAGEALLAVGEAGRPHERAVAEDPEFPRGKQGHELAHRHCGRIMPLPPMSTARKGPALLEADPHRIAFSKTGENQ